MKEDCQPYNMKKKKNKLGLIEGTLRRMMVAFIITLMFLLITWRTLAAFFEDGFGLSSPFWWIIGVSVFLFIGLVVFIERAQLKAYG